MNLRTAGPGKTAPKLNKDFLAFDPTKARPNVLVSPSPPQGEGPQLTPYYTSCKHEYATKSDQSIIPSLDLRSDGHKRYKLAVVCKRCRIHADIRIDYSHSSNPCPNSRNPTHFFRPALEQPPPTSSRIVYDWQCSVEECRARLSVTYRLPRTTDDDNELLTDPKRLKRRYDELVAEDPEREGLRLATDLDALSRLRRYIRDALNPKHEKRQFPANNKRFQEAFGTLGQECRELFESWGFEYAVSTNNVEGTKGTDLHEGQEPMWHLPNPQPISDRWLADGNSERELLEDVEMELLGWQKRISAETGAVLPNPTDQWPSAERDIERTLAAQGYQRFSALRRPTNEELPFFNSLGALPDFADSLIEFSYDRQILCDPDRTAYYFECLQEITRGRNSEQLQMKVAMLESENTISRRDINSAFSAFNITFQERNTLSDQAIIDRFQSYLSDQAPAAQQRSRDHLYKIGVSRNSSALISASRQSVETHEDALTWLGNGVTKDTPDDALLAVFQMKVNGNPADAEVGRNAISTIAKTRKSNMLNNWLLTGRQESDTMTVDEALRHLNIDQKLEDIEQTLWPTIFEAARADRQGDVTNKAIATIQAALSGGFSTGAGEANGTQHPPETWPIGLRSHGNTCYLNSLLQYYFSIQPFRDIVLDYEKYQLNTALEPEKSERIGAANVSTLEIQGCQRFAQDLKYLFRRMIKERSTPVRPEDDLVCRLFLLPTDYHLMGPTANANNVSTDTQPQISNGETNTAVEDPTDNDTVMEQADSKNQSSSSSQTLQDDNEDKLTDGEKVLTPPASPDVEGQDQNPQPEHKPPLPPRTNLRRFSTVTEKALNLAQKKAKDQQDVTEVHDYAMWRLRVGIKPEGADSSNEQQDAFRSLFSIKYLDTRVKDGVQQESKELYNTAIICDVPREDTDIYSSLDKALDLSPVSEDDLSLESYKSIRSLPSILQISTPRIDYNRTTGQAFKSTNMLRLEEEIYLDRYIDHSHPSTLSKRKTSWAWKKQLKQLKEEKARLTDTDMDINSPTAFSNAAKYLTGLDEVNQELEAMGKSRIEGADGDITAALVTAAKEQSARLETIEAEIDDLQKKLAAQFADMKNIKYRLAAVFFHRGSTGSGHYWIYIHDFARKIWRKYNDETVEEHTKLDDIFAANSYAQGTPTYVVYVAEDKLDYVQPVCRDPEPAPVMQQEDVQMGGTSGSGWGDQDTGSQWNTTEPQTQKPRSQMEALDPSLMDDGGDAKTVRDGSGAAWEDTDRQVAADAKCAIISEIWALEDELAYGTIEEITLAELEAREEEENLPPVRSLSPSKRHRPVSEEQEIHETKHRRVEGADEGIADAIAALAAIGHFGEQAFEKDV